MTISNNESSHRYEAYVENELAGFATYERDGDRIVFTHTEVDDAFEGEGVGSALAGGALDDVRATGGLRVVPRCAFIESFIGGHPDYQGLVEARTGG